MDTLPRNKQYNFRINGDLLDEAKEVLADKGMTVSEALNLFVERIVDEQDLPIKTPEQIRAEVFLTELKSSLDKGYQDILEGNLIDADEVFAEYGL